MSQRTIIHVGHEEYIVARGIDDVRADIDAILATGKPGWLRVNHGRAALRIADLLVSPGVDIGLVDANDPPDMDETDVAL